MNQWSKQISATLKGLKVQSEALAETISHNGLRGAVRELFIKQFLLPFLPPHIGIGTGEIINHLGGSSKQVDVVLYNRGRLPPMLMSNDGHGVFPWESVIAVIEVKSRLDAAELRSAILNAYSVRKLVQTIEEPDYQVGGLGLLENRGWHYPIPHYVFAFSSDLVAPGYKKPFAYCVADGPEHQRLKRQRITLQDERQTAASKYLEVQGSNNEEFIAKARDTLEEYEDLKGLTAVGDSDILGVCVLDREWSHGGISFSDEVFRRYSPKPIRTIENFNFYWSSVLSDGSMVETINFLGHLIMLAKEMPKCFEHYSLDRYLR